MNELEQFIDEFKKSHDCNRVDLVMSETTSNKMRLLYPETYLKYEGNISILPKGYFKTNDEVIYVWENKWR